MSILSERNLKHRTDVLDWKRIPRGRCELEYRPPSAESLQVSTLSFLGRLSLVAAIVAIAGVIVVDAVAPFIAGRLTGHLSVAVLCVMGILLLTGVYEPFSQRLESWQRSSILPFVVASVMVLYLFGTLFNVIDVVQGALLVFVLAAIPFTCFVGDQMCQHYIGWMLANPRIDEDTRQKWKTAWNARFEAPKSVEPRRTDLSAVESKVHAWASTWSTSYASGMFVFAFAAISPLLVIAACYWLFRIKLPASQYPLILLAFVVAIGIGRARECRISWQVFLQMLGHWISYGQTGEQPPWVFQSPVGRPFYRECLVYCLLALFCAGTVPIGVQTGSLIGASDIETTVEPTIENVAFKVLLAIVYATVVPPSLLMLGLFFVTAPALAAYFVALEHQSAHEQQTESSARDGYEARLLASQNPNEQRSIILGRSLHHEYPVMFPTDFLFEHMHVVGPTGAGKTALSLIPLTKSLIRRNDGPVVVIDAKGDDAFFHTTRLEAEAAGRGFKWLTNRPNCSTYVFNPFLQEHLKGLTLQEIVGFFISSLNLYHGEDYGRAWFGMSARMLLQEAIKRSLGKSTSRQRVNRFEPIRSFQELEPILRDIARTHDEFSAAQQLCFVIESLADFEQLNFGAQGANKNAIKHAIHMPEVIEEKQVVYFSLAGAMDIASVAQIGRLALHSALAAAMAHSDRHGQPPRVYVVCDEAQIMIAQNIAHVLAQARSYGVACILAHQTMSQLNPPGGVDLRQLVLNCTAVKQFWDARDPVTREYISSISGEVGYFNASWNQLKPRVMAGEFGREFASTDNGPIQVQIKEEVGPRLSSQDIEDYGRDPNVSIVAIHRSQGLSAFQGAFPVVTDWAMSKREHEIRSHETPWPRSKETMDVATAWPENTDETIIAKPNPMTDEEVKQTQNELDDAWEKLGK